MGVLVTVVSMMLAQAPCDAARPTLAVRLGGAGLLPSLARAVREEALYEARQAGFCPIDDERAARATASVDWPEAGALSLTVSVPAGRSTRQLARALELSAVPPDGYALTIGASLGELLREARRELPGLRAVEAELAPAWGLGVALAGEAFTGGQTHGGADLFLRRRLGTRLGLALEAGVRAAVPTEAPSGTVTAFVIASGLHALFDVLQVGRLAVAALAGARLGWLRFEGAARTPASGSVATGWLATVRGGAEVRWATRPALFFVRLTAGLPLASVIATDGGRRVTGAAGFEGGLCAGVGGAF
ncbi:MAG: hypothetical protein IAE78_21925 [Myxococcus sp.]|nr:hypothetical protein [Myxococcus sp.]